MSELLTIKIGIDPNIGHIGGLMLAWHGVFVALGIAAGVYVAVLMARRRGFIDDDSYGVVMVAVIGGIAGGWAYGLWRGLPIWKGLDAGAVGVILGQAIGRVGCVINGEHIGSPSHLPRAVEYTNVNSPSFALGPLQQPGRS